MQCKKVYKDSRISQTPRSTQCQHHRHARPDHPLHVGVQPLKPRFYQADIPVALRYGETHAGYEVDERHGEERQRPEGHTDVVNSDIVAMREDEGSDENLNEDGSDAGDCKAVADLVRL